MGDVLGACEKIMQTPIYTSYTKFTSRFLWIWVNTLPLAMFPLVGAAGVVPTSVIIAFVMLGIEDIGYRVEQPFNVMPLWQYCESIDQSVLQLQRFDQNHFVKRQSHAGHANSALKEWDDLPDYAFDVCDRQLKSFADPLDIDLVAAKPGDMWQRSRKI